MRPAKKRLTAAARLAVGCLGVYLLLWGLGAYLITGDPLEEVDAVVLLAGGDDTRLEEAVRLYQGGFAHYFVLIETGERVGETTGDFIDLVRRKLIGHNIPSDSILHTEPASNSTASEAEQVRGLLERRRLKSAIVVTDPYHTRRVALVYRDSFRDTDIHVIIHPAGGHWFQAGTWWLRPAGWQVILIEYGKIAAMLLGLVK